MKVFRAPLLPQLGVACVVDVAGGVIAVDPALDRAAAVREITALLGDVTPSEVSSRVEHATLLPGEIPVTGLPSPLVSDSASEDVSDGGGVV